MANIKNYLSLAKPRMVIGNMITAGGGFFLASGGQADYRLLAWTLAGLALVIAFGCIFNNYFDRDIDALMERTKDRAFVKGSVSVRYAISFGALSGILGVLILFLYTSLLTLGIAIFGAFMYIVAYTLWAKRRSVHSTLVGSLAGAVPPVVGYTAVTHSIDLVAILLFLILVLWQMSHFYAIALYRIEDYTAARLPVLPVKYGAFATKMRMLLYINAFLAATLILAALGYAGNAYAFVMLVLGICWLGLAIAGFHTTDNKKWARRMFVFSLAIIMMFSIMIGVH